MGFSGKRFLIIVFVVSYFTFGYSQNLLYDGSFEKYRWCPKSITSSGGRFVLEKWSMPTGGTPDYYHTCSDKFSSSIPRNRTGCQRIRTGNAYVGISTSRHFSEYLQTELKESLKKDSLYYIEFWVSRAEISGQASRKLGVLLSELEINIKGSDVISNYSPQVQSNKFINDTSNWVKISGTFTAKGNERYLTVGGFGTNRKDYQKIKYNKRLPFKRVARYYIDDVCLKKVSSQKDCHCEDLLTQTNDSLVDTSFFNIKKKITLPDFTFETGKWIIAEDKVPLLDSLADYLKLNEKAEIVIEGYTDNIGKEEENQLLSEKRAESVMVYLLNIGIGESRITTIGFGSQHPVSSNSTAVGRSKNRRVEIKIE